jgi:hypothetical protein
LDGVCVMMNESIRYERPSGLGGVLLLLMVCVGMHDAGTGDVHGPVTRVPGYATSPVYVPSTAVVLSEIAAYVIAR